MSHVLHLGHLVVVGEDHRVALLGERAHLVGETRGLRWAEDGRVSGSQSRQLYWVHRGFCLIVENRAEPAYQRRATIAHPPDPPRGAPGAYPGRGVRPPGE